MKMQQWMAAGVVALSAWAGTASAAVIWNNGLPGSTDIGGSGMSDTTMAEDFSVGFLANLTSLTFYSHEAAVVGAPGAYRGSISYSILSDNGGLPGTTVVASGNVAPARVNLGAGPGGLTTFENTISLAVNGLAAGTYWVTLHNGLLTDTGFNDFYFAWTDFDGTNTPTVRGVGDDLTQGGVTWIGTEQEHAFRVNGDRVIISTTPSPGTLALIGLTIPVLLARRRRQA